MIFLLLLVIGWLGLIIQSYLASPEWMFGGQFLPVLAVMLYATIFTHFAKAWLLALILGILWDALIGTKIGVTSACLQAMIALVLTQPLTKIRQTPLLQLLVCIASIALFLSLHFLLAFCLQKERFMIGPTLIWNIATSSLLNGVFCLIFFSILQPLFVMLGHQLPRDLRYHV
jgi:cell shape-determining protein MreD